VRPDENYCSAALTLGTLAKYSANPSMEATPLALSPAASDQPGALQKCLPSQRHCLFSGSCGDIPRLRRKQISGLHVSIRQTDLLIFLEQPLCVSDIRRRAGVPSPKLRVTLVAVLFRNRCLLRYILPDMLAVYRAICLVSCGKRPLTFQFV